MRKIEEVIGKLTGAISIISYIGFFFIMLFTVADVVLRFALSSPILGSYEIVERAMFCSVFASFAYAQSQKAHINITMLIDLFPVKLKLFCLSLTGMLSTCAAVFIAYAATKQANTAWAASYATSVLSIPLYPFYWTEFLCMLAFAATLLYDAIKYFFAIFNEDIARRVLSE